MTKLEEIKRVTLLSVSDFRSEYVKKHKPVVITGGIKDWPAYTLWTDNYLKKHAGHIIVGLKSKTDYSNGVSKRENEQEQMVDLATALDYMASSDIADLTYARESHLLNEAPKLKGDIKIPRYLPTSSLRPLPSHFPHNSDIEGPIAWIGPVDTIAQLHWDPEHNLFAQIRGRKYIIILKPDVYECTYPNLFSIQYLSKIPYFIDKHPEQISKLKQVVADLKVQGIEVNRKNFHNALYHELSSHNISALLDYFAQTNNCLVNAENPDFYAHPAFANVRKYQTILNPGDLLFLPYLWRHYVRSLDSSISVNWFFKPTKLEIDTYDMTLKTIIAHLAP